MILLKTTTFLFFLSFIATTTFAQQTINASITHDGIQRSYILYVPANYTGNSAVPLLFNFHGYGSNANEQMWYGDFRPIADTADFIIVHPQGTIDANGATHFNVGWGGSNIDDVDFTSALIDSLLLEYVIDEERIYSTGMSNGGFMSFLLACELSSRIAAIGSVTGSALPATLNSCSASLPTPVLQIHGTADPTVPYNGAAGWTEPIGSLVSYWVNFNNCDAAPQVVAMPDISSSDGSTVEKITYINGYNCNEVVHYKVTNGAHTWPGTIFTSTGTNQDINASVEVWNFVSRYTINGLINCPSLDLLDEKIKRFNVFPNPSADGVFNVEINEEINSMQLFDLQGRKLNVPIDIKNKTIDGTSLADGKYLLQIETKQSILTKEIIIL